MTATLEIQTTLIIQCQDVVKMFGDFVAPEEGVHADSDRRGGLHRRTVGQRQVDDPADHERPRDLPGRLDHGRWD